MEERELRGNLNSDLCLQGFLLHLLVEVEQARCGRLRYRWKVGP